MFIKNFPYLNLKVNDLDFTGFFDSGSNAFLSLTYPYSSANSHLIELEPQKQVYDRVTFTGTERHIERQKVKNPHIHFDGRKYDNFGVASEVYASDWMWTEVKSLDGEVGVRFIKNLGSKCILDFDAMTVKIED
jgi:hypothetical protein